MTRCPLLTLLVAALCLTCAATLRADELTDQQVEQFRQLIKSNPALRDVLLQQYPELAGKLDKPTGKAEPSTAASDPSALLAAEKNRARAEGLVNQLGDATDAQVAPIEAKLAELGADAMVPLKLAALSDNFELRRRAMLIASRLRWRLSCDKALLQRQPKLIETMAGRDDAARAALVDKIAADATADAVGFLGECLADHQSYVRQRAIDGLVHVAASRQGANPGVVRFLETALHDDDRNIRLLAVGAMAKIGGANIDKLARMLNDESPEVRASVVRAMGYSRNKDAVPYIKPLLKDPQWRIRGAALEALEDLLDRESANLAADEVVEALADPDSFVRAYAAKLLARWRYAPAGEKLLAMMKAGTLDEPTAFAALSSMQNPQALKMLLDRYADAATPLKKAEFLQWLNAYNPNTTVDDLLAQALAAPNMAVVRPQLIDFASRRKDGNRFRPIIYSFLESDDELTAQTAWESSRYRLTESPLDSAQVERMLASGKVRQATYALFAAYIYNNADLPALLTRAVEHELPDVAAVTLALVGGHYLHEPFGVTVPTYRRESRGFDYGGRGENSSETAPMPDGLVAAIRRALQREEAPLVRVRAAAVLYRSGKDKAERVAAVIRAALKADDDAQRITALAAIVDEPRPFMDAFDVVAAGKDPKTHNYAVNIMAASGDARYIKVLIDLSADATAEDQALMKALIRSGDPRALEAVTAKLADAPGYYVRQLAEQVKHMPGPGPVKFMEAALSNPKLEDYERYSLVETLVTLPHESVKPLLLKYADDAKLRQYGNVGPRIMARLLELDPQATTPKLKKNLAGGDQQAQATALSTLMQAKPAAALLDLAFDAAQQVKAEPSPTWASLADWLPAEQVRGRFLANLASLNAPLRQGVLGRLTGQVTGKDVAALTAVESDDFFVREYLAALVGALTAEDAAHRPKLEDASTAALVTTLGAAAEWRDGRRAVQAYLNDKRAKVAAAARRGLALYVLTRPKLKLTDAEAAALTRAAMGQEPATAYLAAEALAMHRPDAFKKLDVTAINSDYTKLRLAVALGKDAPPALRNTAQLHLHATDYPTTLNELALLAARYDPEALRFLSPRVLYSYRVNMQVLAESLAEIGNGQALGTLLEGGLISPAWRGFEPIISKLRAKARQGDDALFGRLVREGWITEPIEGDLARLFEVGDAIAPTYALNQALAWAPDKPADVVVKRIGAKTNAGVIASAVAAIKWGDDKARAALVEAASMPKVNVFADVVNRRRKLALEALSICGRPADASPVVKAYAQFNPEEWSDREQTYAIERTLAHIAPQKAAELLAAQSSDRRMMISSRGVEPADIALLTADAPDWPNKGAVGRASGRSPSDYPGVVPFAASFVENRLVLMKAAKNSTATPPSNKVGPQDFVVLPPWSTRVTDSVIRQQVYGDAKAAVRQWLEGQVLVIQRLAVESQGRPASDKARLGDPFDDPSQLGRGEYWPASRGAGAAEDYYPAYTMSETPAVVYLGEAAVAQKLRPLLAHESDRVRTAAMRWVADWRVHSLAGALEQRLRDDGDTDQVIEAAWALAVLQGPKATPTLVKAYEQEKDFVRRVRLACLLRLLGSDAGRADIDRAIALRTMRQLRLRLINPTLQRSAAARWGGYDTPFYTGRQGEMDPTVVDVSLNARLLPWETALATGAADLLAASDARFPLPPGGYDRRYDPPMLTAAADLSRLFLTSDGKLAARKATTNGLPLSALVVAGAESQGDQWVRMYGSDQTSPLFARLMVAEQHLEPHFFVQFAGQSKDLMDLRDKWRTWWSANRDKPRTEWIKQAIAQATDELTHAKWWHRLRAARRLTRLTGQAVVPPNVFDMKAWAAVQQPWRQRGTIQPRAVLVQAGVGAGVLKADALEHVDDDDAYVAALVKLAGFAPQPLAEAALLRLQGWRDAKQLIRHALPWQDSARRQLASWTHARISQATGKDRLFYAPADLPDHTSR